MLQKWTTQERRISNTMLSRNDDRTSVVFNNII